ncbi:MAG: YbaB/EbfC family nucleoid-associated protein [Alphaproteobacteria bacterium]
MKHLDQMMKQMQNKMQDAQNKIEQTEIHGASGGGMVQVTLMGKGDMRALKIDKSLVDPQEVEVLEDLVIAAVNDARNKLDQYTAEEMGKVTQGLPLPGGLKLPF